jgi:molecular chaperone HscB
MSDNYFKIFDIDEPKFSIDKDSLEAKFIKLQQQYHPDKAKSDDVRLIFVKKSSDINNAYEVISDDVSRATYLLGLKNIRVNQEKDNNYAPNQENLVMQMELREEIFDNSNDLNDLKNYLKEVKEKFNQSTEKFESFYSEEDFENASQQAMKMQYLKKLIADIKSLIKVKKSKV